MVDKENDRENLNMNISINEFNLSIKGSPLLRPSIATNPMRETSM